MCIYIYIYICCFVHASPEAMSVSRLRVEYASLGLPADAED